MTLTQSRVSPSYFVVKTTNYLTNFLQIRILPLVIGSAAAILASTSPARALTWTLNNVQFQDGATATGSFDYDATASVYSNVNISLSNGTIYNSQIFNTSNLNFQTASQFSVCSNGVGCPSSNYIYFVISNNLSNTPQTLSLTGNSYGLTDAGGSITSSSNLISGSITGASATVPFNIPGGATIPALGSVLALGVMRKARKIAINKRLVNSVTQRSTISSLSNPSRSNLA